MKAEARRRNSLAWAERTNTRAEEQTRWSGGSVPQPACNDAREALTVPPSRPAGRPTQQQCPLPPKPAVCSAGRSKGAAVHSWDHETNR